MKKKTGAVIAERLHAGTDATTANVKAAATRSKRKSNGIAKGIAV